MALGAPGALASIMRFVLFLEGRGGRGPSYDRNDDKNGKGEKTKNSTSRSIKKCHKAGFFFLLSTQQICPTKCIIFAYHN